MYNRVCKRLHKNPISKSCKVYECNEKKRKKKMALEGSNPTPRSVGLVIIIFYI